MTMCIHAVHKAGACPNLEQHLYNNNNKTLLNMPNGWKKNARRDAVLGAGVLGAGAVGLGRKKAARGGSSKQFAGNWRGDAKIGAGGIHSLTRGGLKSRLGKLAQKERCFVAVALNERGLGVTGGPSTRSRW